MCLNLFIVYVMYGFKYVCMYMYTDLAKAYKRCYICIFSMWVYMYNTSTVFRFKIM